MCTERCSDSCCRQQTARASRQGSEAVCDRMSETSSSRDTHGCCIAAGVRISICGESLVCRCRCLCHTPIRCKHSAALSWLPDPSDASGGSCPTALTAALSKQPDRAPLMTQDTNLGRPKNGMWCSRAHPTNFACEWSEGVCHTSRVPALTSLAHLQQTDERSESWECDLATKTLRASPAAVHSSEYQNTYN